MTIFNQASECGILNLHKLQCIYVSWESISFNVGPLFISLMNVWLSLVASGHNHIVPLGMGL